MKTFIPLGRAGHAPRSSGRGFSLLEILLVLLLIAVFAGLSVPRLSGTLKTIQLKETAKNMSYLMRYAQSRAALLQKVHKVRVDTAARTYRLWEEEAADAFREATGRFGRAFVIPGSVQVSADKTDILFYPDGKIEKARITLTDDNGKTLVVSTQEKRADVTILQAPL